MAERDEAVNAEMAERYNAVHRRAFEEHVLALLSRSAPIYEEGFKEIHGQEPSPTFRSAELIGSYPNTTITIRMYDRVRDREMSSRYAIWDSDFEDANGQMREPGYIAGEIMIWARGG
jgi:hypothetical protein